MATQHISPAEYRALAKKPKRSKYGAVKVKIDGITLDSKLEARRYGQLKLLEKAGHIHRLEVHPKYPIFVDGIFVCNYLPDFSYFSQSIDGKQVCEDTKGKSTALFEIKWKLVKIRYPCIDWRIVRA